MTYIAGALLFILSSAIVLRGRGGLPLLLALSPVALFGAKSYSAVERGGFAWHQLAWELEAGYRYPGAILASLIVLPILWRLLRPAMSVGEFLDACVLGICAAMVVVRAGCFIAGCCHGTLTEVPWATRYGVDTSPWHAHRTAGLIERSAEWSAYGHPLQLYFLFAIAAIGLFLLWFRRHRQTYDGQLTLIFMVLNGLSKGALESLRFSYVPSLQVYSFTMAAIGLAGLGVMSLRRRKQANSGPPLASALR